MSCGGPCGYFRPVILAAFVWEGMRPAKTVTIRFMLLVHCAGDPSRSGFLRVQQLNGPLWEPVHNDPVSHFLDVTPL